MGDTSEGEPAFTLTLRLALVVFYVIASRRRGNLISEWHRESSGGSHPHEDCFVAYAPRNDKEGGEVSLII
ncbi:MAG: hypothetical protein AUK00_00655 [Dehalococcoidia bacterium CG2_30_46_9]|nr:MAG: hypothetical protein AUK00_00655 [Dehalococcoidia bacterium CG2_30_46_9]PIX27217.1 MAG: hypothetical protein COZ67_03390 [Chloroflexi bacterium CG_4_8_14_3_um_filter_45_15]